MREHLLNIEERRRELQAQGASGVLKFMAAAALATGFGVPRIWISALAGALYGAFEGAVLGHVSSVIGATINFYVARIVLRGPIQRRMPARMTKWYERFNQNGFRWLLYMRLFPLSNATVTNCAGGISKMSYWSFLGATMIGYTPLTIVFALFGSSAAKQSFWQLGIGGVLLVLVIAGQWLYRRWQTPAEAEAEEEAEG